MKRCFWMTATLFCVLRSILTSAQEFTVKGSRINTYYNKGVEEVYKSDGQFRVCVSGCQWLVQETHLEDGNFGQYEVGFDGTNIYQTIHLYLPPPPAGAEIPIGLSGYISPGNVPEPRMVNNPAPLWLAYASGCYFRNITANLLKPVWGLEYDGLFDSGFEVKAEWNCSSISPRLPLNIVYYNDGKGRGLAGAKPVVIDAPAPYNLGFTNAIYTCELTNVGNIAVPVRFKLKRFFYNPLGTNNCDLLLASQDEVEITNVSLECEVSSFRPVLPERALIYDRRLARAYPGYAARYITTNGDWMVLALKDLETRHRLDQQALLAAHAQLPAKRKSALLLMFLVTAILLSFAAKAMRSTGQP